MNVRLREKKKENQRPKSIEIERKAIESFFFKMKLLLRVPVWFPEMNWLPSFTEFLSVFYLVPLTEFEPMNNYSVETRWRPKEKRKQ